MSFKVLRNTCLALMATMFLAAGVAAQPRSGPSQTQELTEEITEKDRVFFDALFNKCDVETLGAMVTDDFEFYHDKGGNTANSKAQFVDAIRGMCERQKTGEDYRARRELMSMEVYPLNNYGAVQVGVHRFYQKIEGKGEKLVEIAKFTNLWKKEGDAWRMSRVLSYDHQLTP